MYTSCAHFVHGSFMYTSLIACRKSEIEYRDMMYSLRPKKDVPIDILRKLPSLSSDKPGNPLRLLRRLATRRPAAPSPRRLLRRLATCRPPSPPPVAASLRPHQEIKREGIPFSAKPATCRLRLRRRRSCPRGRSSSSSSRTRAPRPRPAAEVNGCCSSSRSLSSSSRFSSSSASSLHRRFCFCCPLAHGNAAIGGGLGAEEWMLLPLISGWAN